MWSFLLRMIWNRKKQKRFALFRAAELGTMLMHIWMACVVNRICQMRANLRCVYNVYPRRTKRSTLEAASSVTHIQCVKNQNKHIRASFSSWFLFSLIFSVANDYMQSWQASKAILLRFSIEIFAINQYLLCSYVQTCNFLSLCFLFSVVKNVDDQISLKRRFKHVHAPLAHNKTEKRTTKNNKSKPNACYLTKLYGFLSILRILFSLWLVCVWCVHLFLGNIAEPSVFMPPK